MTKASIPIHDPDTKGAWSTLSRSDDGEAFVIPNPWDAGSAKVLAALWFPALATTSSGFAFTLGRPDGGVTLDEVIAHTSMLAGATSLPVSI
jgi:2-methylisocitrate lyase-like PEP mutase family enzyme